MASTTTFTQGILPSWYTNYAQDVLANQQAISNRPYTAYNGPTIAPFTPAQDIGQAMTVDASTAYQPVLNGAVAGTAGTMGQSVADNVAPLLANAAQNQTAGALAGFGQANNLAAGAVSANPANAASPYFQQSANTNLFAQPSPYWSQSANYADASTNPYGIAAAQPYMQNASNSSVSNINSYMNPYTSNVVQGFGDAAARNLQQLLPQLESRYIGSGQFGGHSANGTFQPTGLNTESLQALAGVDATAQQQQMQALQQGYTQALNASQTDLARQAQLGQQAGQLGTAQQGALANAGQQFSTLGQQNAALGQAQQGNLTQIGSQMGQLGVAQQQAQQAAANTAANTAAQQGQLAQNQQYIQLSAAQQAANNQNTGISQQLAASGQLGQLAQQTQNQGLTGASAVTGVGAQQQALDQANLSKALADFNAQNAYPQQQVSAMANTIGQVAPAVPQAQIQYSNTQVPTASTLQTIAGLGLGLAGSGAFGGTPAAAPAAAPAA